MIKLNFVEPKDADWIDWKERCADATTELIKNIKEGRTIKISKLYKEKKDVFFKHDEYFYAKCVYCESIISNSHPGDVEHFRPKGKVTDLANKEIIISINGIETPHPGYYWLAYEISNLMPACEDCNRPSSGNSGGKQIGKWMKFPVNGQNALNPGDEKKEDYLFINPLSEDPDIHLSIDNLSIIHPVGDSIKGKTCIEVFGLNDRSSLLNERQEMYKQVKKELKLAHIAILMNSEDKEEYKNKIKDYQNGKRPYTMAARKAINDGRNEYQKETGEIYK